MSRGPEERQSSKMVPLESPPSMRKRALVWLGAETVLAQVTLPDVGAEGEATPQKAMVTE